MNFSPVLLLAAFILSYSTALKAQPSEINSQKNEQYYVQIDSLLALKKINDALQVCDELIQFAEITYGQSDTAYANALALKSECFLYAKKYPDAISLQNEALKIRRQIPGEESSCVSSLNTLWQLHKPLGQYDRAGIFLKEAIAIQEKIGPTDPEMAILCSNMGYHYRETGYFELAEAYYLKSMTIGLVHYGENGIENGPTLNNLGNLYRSMGNYKEAEYYYSRLYTILYTLNGASHPKTRLALNNLALINEDMGNTPKAETYYLKALSIDISVDTSSYIASLINLATLYSKNGFYDKAEQFNLHALELQKKFFVSENADISTTYYNLGSLFLDKKDPATARSYFSKALEIRLRLFGDKHHLYGLALLGLSKADYQEEKQDDCILNAKAAKEILVATVGNKHPYYENTIFTLADAYLHFNQPDSAESYFIEGLNLQYYLIKQQFSFMSEMEKEIYLKKISKRSSAFLSYCLKRKESNPSITGEVYNYVLNTKGLLLKSSSMLRNTILNGTDQELKDKYDQWIALKKKINTLYNTPIEKRKEDAEKLEEEANLIEKELVRSGSGLEENNSIMENSWQDVQAQLKKQEAAIEFFHFKKTKDSTIYCALILKADSKAPELVELFEEKQLREILGTNISNDYKQINAVYGTKTKKNAALYNLIWAPLEKFLDKTTKVNVSPSGLLHKISFAGLAKSNGKYLADELAVSILSTTSGIGKSTLLDITADSRISLFGGIQYSADSSNSYPWQYLNGTKTESDALSGTFMGYTKNVAYFTGNNATKARFISIAQNSTILHIATHGFFFPDPAAIMEGMIDTSESGDIQFRGGPSRAATLYANSQNPLMRSGLVFAGANDFWNGEITETENNGVLTALDVINIDLRQNKLVVMSACESGLGDIVGGEGVYGLQRAFKMAGTDFIIMSLWQVPDQETAEFMQTFYRLLFEKKDIALAFSETQKIMRKKYDPYYWAAFVLLR
ncbi:MAG: CHAT domain-containing protein [Bacteroidetes bacterium]|nr:CHAT domain-containing protein [Bacteroidota bacterium]